MTHHPLGLVRFLVRSAWASANGCKSRASP